MSQRDHCYYTFIMQWFHTTLQHPGIKRMQATLRESFYWPGMDAAVGA
jgi:hypothetical protein